MKILVSGASGFIGEKLCRALQAKGHVVLGISRTPEKSQQRQPSIKFLGWDSAALQESMPSVDAVINLAGEPLFSKRWNNNQKNILRNSRIDATSKLAQLLADNPTPPKIFISASGVGYYGSSLDKTFSESNGAGDDFVASMAKDWEGATDAAKKTARVVNLRIGIVLAKDGGALKRMLPAFKMGGGGPIGSGQQWMSWVYIDDLINIIELCLTHPELRGPINACSPFPVRNKDFSKSLGKALGMPAVIPLPGAALKILLGPGAEVVLTGQKVHPQVALESEYIFTAPHLENALSQIFSKR